MWCKFKLLKELLFSLLKKIEKIWTCTFFFPLSQKKSDRIFSSLRVLISNIDFFFQRKKPKKLSLLKKHLDQRINEGDHSSAFCEVSKIPSQFFRVFTISIIFQGPTFASQLFVSSAFLFIIIRKNPPTNSLLLSLIEISFIKTHLNPLLGEIISLLLFK